MSQRLARDSLSKTYKTYIYLLGTAFGTGKKPFSVLANGQIGTGKNTFRAKPKIGTGPDMGPGCGQLLMERHEPGGEEYARLEMGRRLVRSLFDA